MSNENFHIQATIHIIKKMCPTIKKRKTVQMIQNKNITIGYNG